MLRSPTSKPKRNLELELDRLESRLAELRVLYEQYFVDVFPQPPDKQHKEVVKSIRYLLKAPFKNSQTRFRLRQLINRYQTYATYWERVKKQREEGTYHRDVFKADLRERLAEEMKQEASKSGAAEKGFKQLYSSYEEAVKKTGVVVQNLNYDSFKRSLIKQAKKLKAEKGVSKLKYKIMVKDGKVVVKASAKK